MRSSLCTIAFLTVASCMATGFLGAGTPASSSEGLAAVDDDSAVGGGERAEQVGDARHYEALAEEPLELTKDTESAAPTALTTNTSEFSECFTATCLSTAVFGQTLLAQNRNILSWAAPDHVRFVKGDLAAVSSYLFTGTGELPDSTSLNISSDHPGAGSGLYYLIRSLACGSWQTAPGAEPGRDVLP